MHRLAVRGAGDHLVTLGRDEGDLEGRVARLAHGHRYSIENVSRDELHVGDAVGIILPAVCATDSLLLRLHPGDENEFFQQNPELIRLEWVPWTRKIISSIVPMYNLTVEGIEEAMDYLRTGGKNQYTTVQMLKGLAY